MSTSAQDIFSPELPELLQRHLEHLTQGSGLPLDVIRERGYRSILGKKPLADVGFAPFCGHAFVGLEVGTWNRDDDGVEVLRHGTSGR